MPSESNPTESIAIDLGSFDAEQADKLDNMQGRIEKHIRKQIRHLPLDGDTEASDNSVDEAVEWVLRLRRIHTVVNPKKRYLRQLAREQLALDENAKDENDENFDENVDISKLNDEELMLLQSRILERMERSLRADYLRQMGHINDRLRHRRLQDHLNAVGYM